MSSSVQNLQEEKKQYWLIFLGLLGLNALVLCSRSIPVIFWVGVASAFTLVLFLFMHLKTEKRVIHITVALAIFFLFGMVVLIIGANYSVPEGTHYNNFDYQPKPIHIPHHES